MKLRDYEESFLRAVRFDAAAPALLSVVVGGGELDPAAAVDVYRKMYWWRIVAALHDLLPRTSRLLGVRAFTREACAFLAARPSTFHALERLGRPFSEFLGERDLPEVARGLASLEGAFVESLLAPDPEGVLLSRADLADPAFVARRVRTVPSVRTLRVDAAALDAYREIDPDGPSRDEPLEDRAPVALARWVAFCRPEHSVLHAEVTEQEAALLRQGSFALGDLLAALAPRSAAPPDADDRDGEGDVDRIFRRLAELVDRRYLTLE